MVFYTVICYVVYSSDRSFGRGNLHFYMYVRVSIRMIKSAYLKLGLFLRSQFTDHLETKSIQRAFKVTESICRSPKYFVLLEIKLPLFQELLSLPGEREVPGPAAGLQAGSGQGAG